LKKINIRKKLEEIDFSLDQVSLGDFDYIGEFTAKKSRDRNSDLYKNAGCFFRPNYERGILIYALVSKFKIDSYLEIGFGRGYSALCAAKAMVDNGIDGSVTTIDPNLDEKFLEHISQYFPTTWFKKIKFIKAFSQEAIPNIESSFELVYIDGDYRYEAVKSDWEMLKDRYSKFLLFDDYCQRKQKDIDCSRVIDEIEDPSKELIVMDRRIFFDDRRMSDDEIDYGQVLLTHTAFNMSDFIVDW
jgi:predicted O-methyltransferase YrrM